MQLSQWMPLSWLMMMIRFQLDLHCENGRVALYYFELILRNLSMKFYHSHSHLQRKMEEKKIQQKKSQNQKVKK